MPLAVGTRLGHYEVVAAIGSGGMGEVYRARDTKLGREVAAKVLPDAFLHDTERIARFEREAKALAAFNHPHIASLYEMEQDGGRHFLVMELVEGVTLRELIAAGSLPLEQALDIARQIAEALEAAHEKGVVHRDLKPANGKTKLRRDWRSVVMRPRWPAPMAAATGERGPRVRCAHAAGLAKRLDIAVTESEGELDPRLR